METSPQSPNQLPDHMRAYKDPRTLAEDINPATVPALSNKINQYAAWQRIEAAIYSPAEIGHTIADAQSILTQTAEQATDISDAYGARFTLATLPLFEKRAALGLESIDQNDLFAAYASTTSIIGDTWRTFNTMEATNERLELLALLGERVTTGLLQRQQLNVANHKAFPASVREDQSHIPAANQDLNVIVNNAVKVPVQVKLNWSDTGETVDEKKSHNAGVATVGFFAFLGKYVSLENPAKDRKTNDWARLEKVIGLMQAESTGELQPGSAQLEQLNILTNELTQRVTAMYEKITDSSGNRLPWDGTAVEQAPGHKLTRQEIIAMFNSYVLSKTTDAAHVVGAAKGSQLIKLNKATRPSYNTVEVESSSQEVITQDDALAIRAITVTTQTIKLLQNGEQTLHATLTETPYQNTFSHPQEAMARLITRLQQFDNQLTWQQPSTQNTDSI